MLIIGEKKLVVEGRGESGGIWELSVLSAHFFCKPETALKNEDSIKTKTFC